MSRSVYPQVHVDSIGRPVQVHCVEFGGEGSRPRIVVLCGSTRFYAEFQQANYDFTMKGYIVLSVGFYPRATTEQTQDRALDSLSRVLGYHGEGVGHNSDEKVLLDELHKRKIDMADEVYVINKCGYIGESTQSEIEYASKLGKEIRFMIPNQVNVSAGIAEGKSDKV